MGMNIVLSAHFDVVKPVKYIRVKDGKLLGLVDNFAGVFASYNAACKTGVELFLTNFEELPGFKGAVGAAKTFNPKNTLVIVVDTCTDTEDRQAYIGNGYGVDLSLLKKKFGKKILFKDGYYEPDMDETYVYGSQFKLKCFYFGIPISGGYHDVDNKVSIKTIDTASDLLIEVIKFLKKNS